MKLNIGSSVAKGEFKDSSWVNLDLFKARGVNVLGDGTKLPFKDNSFTDIVCIHTLEHLTRDKIPEMLSEMCRVVAKGGSCKVEVPDFKAIVYKLSEAFKTGDTSAQHIWRTSIYGKTERPGMAHHFGFDYWLLADMMKTAGFDVIKELIDKKDMISSHYKQEPILLVEGIK